MIPAKTVRTLIDAQLGGLRELAARLDAFPDVMEHGATRDRLVAANTTLKHRIVSCPARVAALGPFDDAHHVREVVGRAVRHVVEAIDDIQDVLDDLGKSPHAAVE